jgi:hypothetical protein
MKFLFFILFSIFTLTSIAVATTFSPGTLVFMTDSGEELCQSAFVESDSRAIEVSDKWASDVEQKWSVDGFDNSAEDHGVSINYPADLDSGENNIEVCLTAQEEGEYHGALVFREEQQGNSIVQFPIWLKVVVEEQEIEVATTSSQSSGGGSSGGGSSGSTVKKDVVMKDNIETNSNSDNKESEESESEINQNSAPITGNVIGVMSKSKSIISAVVIIFVVLAITLFSWKRKSTASVPPHLRS